MQLEILAANTWFVISSVLFTTVFTLESENMAPGPAACANITSMLGPCKVSYNTSLDYSASLLDYWNLRQSKYKPSCIVYPRCVKDVQVILQVIKSYVCNFAIRAGGHNTNDFFSSVDKGVLIDLRKLNHKSYDPVNKWAKFGPGHTFGEVYEYFNQYKCAIVGARLAGVGTGLALGGGLSYLSTEYGLTCDNFRKLQVVLPNGTIVTASKEENCDLFFFLKGGGGNACGIVTEYTVQCRPSGTFYAGNIVCQITEEAAIYVIGQALADFTRYQDPKAAIIGTYQMTAAPDITFNLFAVYHAANSGEAFKNFTNIKYCVSTLGEKTYLQVVNMPFPGSTESSRAYNVFRVQVHDINDDSWKEALKTWIEWGKQEKGNYEIISLDWQPIALSLTEASKEQGGNAMNMPDGPWMWFNYLVRANSFLSPKEYDALQIRYRDMVKKTPNARNKPLFLNDAHKDQNPHCTFSTLARLQEIKKMCDPDGFFSSKTGGWCFNCCNSTEFTCTSRSP